MMEQRKKSYFNIPKLDFSRLSEPLTDKECEKAVAEVEKGISREERLKFIEDIEKHPSHLSSWEMPISFKEYARRVRAGEYD